MCAPPPGVAHRQEVRSEDNGLAELGFVDGADFAVLDSRGRTEHYGQLEQWNLAGNARDTIYQRTKRSWKK